MRKKKIVEGVEIVDLGAKGKVIGKKDGEAYLTKGVIPGDIVTLDVRKKRKGMKEGMVQTIESSSPFRVDPVCAHQAFCGGCSWQEMDYAKQIEYKEKNVFQQLRRIGHFENIPSEPIMGAHQIFHYRNKMEFTFVKERWLTPEELQKDEHILKDEGAGFHVPGRFDWVLHIDECHLQHSFHNEIRNFVFDKAKELEIPFFNPKDKTGILRNILLRNNRKDEWMILIIVSEVTDSVTELYTAIIERFPSVISLWSIINDKVNDSFTDCPATLIHGRPELTETFHRADGGGSLDYLIGPKSFFQTNSHQAERLYGLVYDWAGLTGNELVYDLYTGTGSIALFVADKAQKVVGVEYVPEAIEDAKKNAELNSIGNCQFLAGDMKDVLTADFISEHGRPDVLITDPPRAGMHADVVERILEAKPKRIVYVSCDPATQARDLAMLASKYTLIRTRAVDMFPHTSHVENVALLELGG